MPESPTDEELRHRLRQLATEAQEISDELRRRKAENQLPEQRRAQIRERTRTTSRTIRR